MKINEFSDAAFFGALCTIGDVLESTTAQLQNEMEDGDVTLCDAVQKSLPDLLAATKLLEEVRDRVQEHFRDACSEVGK